MKPFLLDWLSRLGEQNDAMFWMTYSHVKVRKLVLIVIISLNSTTWRSLGNILESRTPSCLVVLSWQSRVRIIENMNINEEQNRAKLIKLRKRHLIVKQHFYKSFGIQYRLHLHFYLLWKQRIACAWKTWQSWINVRDASFRAWNFT